MSSVFSVGQKFSSFIELDTALKKYQAESFCVLVVRDSRGIQAAQKRLTNKTLNPQLKYIDVKYACHHGGNTESMGVGRVRCKHQLPKWDANSDYRLELLKMASSLN